MAGTVACWQTSQLTAACLGWTGEPRRDSPGAADADLVGNNEAVGVDMDVDVDMDMDVANVFPREVRRSGPTHGH
jgi:hypothetical protein